jgi:hypothetical protein
MTVTRTTIAAASSGGSCSLVTSSAGMSASQWSFIGSRWSCSSSTSDARGVQFAGAYVAESNNVSLVDMDLILSGAGACEAFRFSNCFVGGTSVGVTGGSWTADTRCADSSGIMLDSGTKLHRSNITTSKLRAAFNGTGISAFMRGTSGSSIQDSTETHRDITFIATSSNVGAAWHHQPLQRIGVVSLWENVRVEITSCQRAMCGLDEDSSVELSTLTRRNFTCVATNPTISDKMGFVSVNTAYTGSTITFDNTHVDIRAPSTSCQAFQFTGGSKLTDSTLLLVGGQWVTSCTDANTLSFGYAAQITRSNITLDQVNITAEGTTGYARSVYFFTASTVSSSVVVNASALVARGASAAGGLVIDGGLLTKSVLTVYNGRVDVEGSGASATGVHIGSASTRQSSVVFSSTTLSARALQASTDAIALRIQGIFNHSSLDASNTVLQANANAGRTAVALSTRLSTLFYADVTLPNATLTAEGSVEARGIEVSSSSIGAGSTIALTGSRVLARSRNGHAVTIMFESSSFLEAAANFRATQSQLGAYGYTWAANLYLEEGSLVRTAAAMTWDRTDATCEADLRNCTTIRTDSMAPILTGGLLNVTGGLIDSKSWHGWAYIWNFSMHENVNLPTTEFVMHGELLKARSYASRTKSVSATPPLTQSTSVSVSNSFSESVVLPDHITLDTNISYYDVFAYTKHELMVVPVNVSGVVLVVVPLKDTYERLPLASPVPYQAEIRITSAAGYSVFAFTEQRLPLIWPVPNSDIEAGRNEIVVTVTYDGDVRKSTMSAARPRGFGREGPCILRGAQSPSGGHNDSHHVRHGRRVRRVFRCELEHDVRRAARGSADDQFASRLDPTSQLQHDAERDQPQHSQVSHRAAASTHATQRTIGDVVLGGVVDRSLRRGRRTVSALGAASGHDGGRQLLIACSIPRTAFRCRGCCRCLDGRDTHVDGKRSARRPAMRCRCGLQCCAGMERCMCRAVPLRVRCFGAGRFHRE